MTAQEWFVKAREGRFAIGAFKIDNFDILKAVFSGAKNKKSPVILEFTPEKIGYFGFGNIVDIVVNARNDYKIPILLSLGGAKNFNYCMEVIEKGGFDIVHFDGSGLEFGENLNSAKQLVEAAHKKGILVEGQTDKIFGPGVGELSDVDLDKISDSFTDPKQALEFVLGTGVDLYTPLFGNVIGDFVNQPQLDFNLLSQIRDVIPNTFIVLAGGSGLSAKQIENSIVKGRVVKVDIGEELTKIFYDSMEETMEEDNNKLVNFELTPEIILAAGAVVEEKISVLGSAGMLQ